MRRRNRKVRYYRKPAHQSIPSLDTSCSSGPGRMSRPKSRLFDRLDRSRDVQNMRHHRSNSAELPFVQPRRSQIRQTPTIVCLHNYVRHIRLRCPTSRLRSQSLPQIAANPTRCTRTDSSLQLPLPEFRFQVTGRQDCRYRSFCLHRQSDWPD